MPAGYFQVEYDYASRLSNVPSLTSVKCGATPAAADYATLSANNYSGQDLYWSYDNGGPVGSFTQPGNLGQMGVYIDADRLVSHPEPVTTPQILGTPSSYRNYDGTTSNLAAKLPQNMVDSCIYAPTWTRRYVKFKIEKPGYYWITYRGEGPDPSQGANLAAICLYALGGPSWVPPSYWTIFTVPTAGLKVGTRIVLNGIEIKAQ